jgi:hypothetical protein
MFGRTRVTVHAQATAVFVGQDAWVTFDSPLAFQVASRIGRRLRGVADEFAVIHATLSALRISELYSF